MNFGFQRLDILLSHSTVDKSKMKNTANYLNYFSDTIGHRK